MIKLFSILFLFPLAYAQNTSIKSFGEAKGKLKKIYGNKSITFYCQCPYQKKSIKLKKCGLKLKKFKKRSRRLEWEHIVPAHAFGQSFIEWRNSEKICGYKKTKSGKLKKISSRKCASKKNKLFKAMEADIYNLVPAIGSVNALRSNFSMSEIGGTKKLICNTELVISNRKIMPPSNRKGDIARIYMYMDQTYPGRGIISKKNRSLFKKWNDLDPVDKYECSLYRKKLVYQKNINPVLDKKCRSK